MTGSEHDATSTQNTDEQLIRLLKLAGKRPEPSDAMTEKVRAAVSDAWQQSVQQRRRGWRTLQLATAAAILAGVAVVLRMVLPGEPGIAEIARIDRIDGSVELRDAATGTWQRVAGELVNVAAGTQVRTLRDGRVAFALAGGTLMKVEHR